MEQKQEAQAQVENLSAEIDRLQSSSPHDNGEADQDARVAELEQKLEETESSYNARMQQLEQDYQIAVHYVK